jgi:GTP-binding protein YchF
VNFTIFGYPKTGKTSLFNILTGSRAGVSAFEVGKREANERVCPLPDARLDALAALYPDRKRMPAAIDVVDLAGIAFGEVKASVFLNALRKADALLHVVRGFPDDALPHPKNRIDPAGDIRAMEEELLLADLVSIEARLERIDKDLKKMKSPEGEKERDLLLRLKSHLEAGGPLRTYVFPETEEKIVRAFAFLSQKPIAHLINAGEGDLGRLAEVERAFVPGPRAAALAFCGKIEREILEIEDEAERTVFREEYGLRESTAPRFFPLVLALLDLIVFYTIGKEEVRAWSVRRHSPALKAAGAIHTDIEKGFIRAEVVSLEELLRRGGWALAKEAGALRLEGKDYIVRDADVIYFRFAL